MRVQERRDPLQCAPHVMVGVSHVEETALGSTFCAHPRPPGGFWNSISLQNNPLTPELQQNYPSRSSVTSMITVPYEITDEN